MEFVKAVPSIELVTSYNWDYEVEIHENLYKTIKKDSLDDIIRKINVHTHKVYIEKSKLIAWYFLPARSANLTKDLLQFLMSSAVKRIKISLRDTKGNRLFSIYAQPEMKSPNWSIELQTESAMAFNLKVTYDLLHLKVG